MLDIICIYIYIYIVYKSLFYVIVYIYIHVICDQLKPRQPGWNHSLANVLNLRCLAMSTDIDHKSLTWVGPIWETSGFGPFFCTPFAPTSPWSLQLLGSSSKNIKDESHSQGGARFKPKSSSPAFAAPVSSKAAEFKGSEILSPKAGYLRSMVFEYQCL